MLRSPRSSIEALQTFPFLPALSSQTRGLQLFDIFNKEKAKERQERLKDEASRGYFDDFKELRESKGKLFAASSKLILKHKALLLPNGSTTSLIKEAKKKRATLLCIAFRSGAEDLLASWSKPFGRAYDDSKCQHIELSLVDSVVMTWWPFKNLILNGKSAQAEASGMKPLYLFSFGDAREYFEALGLSNRLTGYVFLIDQEGLIRWRGSGMASAEESKTLLRCSSELLDQER